MLTAKNAMSRNTGAFILTKTSLKLKICTTQPESVNTATPEHAMPPCSRYARLAGVTRSSTRSRDRSIVSARAVTLRCVHFVLFGSTEISQDRPAPSRLLSPGSASHGEALHFLQRSAFELFATG